jgi:excisionase family DNA binding protein
MGMEDLPERLTASEAAAFLRIPRRALLQLCKENRIGFVRINYRNFLFTRRDLAEFLERRHFKAKGVYENS